MTPRAELDRLAVLVHELRSPVAALAEIDAVYGDASLDAAARKRLVELALSACRGIERVVADAAVSSVRLEAVDVGRLVREVATAGSLDGSDVRAVVPGGVTRIEADPVRLRQALDNLVANALRHAPGERVVISVESGESVLLVSVSDRGPGIAPGDQERIFEPGVRLGERAGSGLGLAVAQAIAVAHGGTVTVASRPGEGATFTLELPARARA